MSVLSSFRLLALFGLMCSTLIFTLSCNNKDDLSSYVDFNKEIKSRGSEIIWPDSLFESPNEYILWLFENHKDSAIYYVDNHADFMNFAARKNYTFSGTSSNNNNLVLDDGELIFTYPYYIQGQGFTNSFVYGDWNSAESGALNAVLDSIYDAIGNTELETVVQQLITNGKNRIIAMDYENQIGLLNTLKQVSYSISLLYDLVDIYGNDDPQGFAINPCVLAGVMADVCTMALMESHVIGSAFDGMTEMQKMEVIRSVSAQGYSGCFVDCG